MGKTNPSTQSPDGSNGSPSKKPKLEQPRTIPSAADLRKGKVSSGGTKRDRPDVEEGVLHLYALTYCKNGSVYGPQFGTGELLAVHFLWNGYPNLLFNFLGGIKSCVIQRHEENESEPATMEAFNTIYGLKLVLTSDADEDQVGTYKLYRCVIYVDKSKEKELYLFLDSWLTFRKKNTTPGDPSLPEVIPIVFHTENTDLEFTYDNGMENPYTITNEPFKDKVNVFEGHPPCYPARPVVASLESISSSTISVVFAGNTKPFKAMFKSKNIQLSKEDASPGTGNNFDQWYYFLENQDISTDDAVKNMVELFRELFVGAPLFVSVKKWPATDDTRFKSFLNSIKAEKNVLQKTT